MDLVTFRTELIKLVNRFNLEAESDTPDFMLADYMLLCLRAFDEATRLRDRWYGNSKPRPATQKEGKP